MNYVGVMYVGGQPQPTGVVQCATLSDRRVSIDWKEGAWAGHLEADSTDGERFQGTYEYVPPCPGEYALRLYRSGTEVILFGVWKNHTGEEGTWLFLLTPGTKPVALDFDSLLHLFSGKRSQ
jgi:hypothetical protein